MNIECSDLITVTRFANRNLSSGGLPLSPGYSKSRSSPSKFLFRRNSMLLFMNSRLLSTLLSISVMTLTPKFHPPTASRRTIDGWRVLISVKLANLQGVRKKNNCRCQLERIKNSGENRIHMSVRPSVPSRPSRPSVCPSVRLSICPSVHLSICPSVHPFIRLNSFFCLSAHSIRPYTRPSAHQFVPLSAV